MMAELIIGRHTRANMVNALQAILPAKGARLSGKLGYCRHGNGRLILCFYSIVAGWMIAFMLEPAASVLGLASWAVG